MGTARWGNEGAGRVGAWRQRTEGCSWWAKGWIMDGACGFVAVERREVDSARGLAGWSLRAGDRIAGLHLLGSHMVHAGV